MKYYRFSMNYIEFNFSRFKEEYESKDKKVRWFLTAKNSSIESDDIVFIYCSNMPDLVNRYIIKAKVNKVIKKSDSNEIFKDFEDCNTCVLLDEIQALNSNHIYDFSANSIKNNYKDGYGGFQGTYAEITNKKMITDLCNCKCSSVNDLLDTYVDGDCFFKNKIKMADHNYSHPTFVKDNGVTYIEYHHFIHRCKGYDKDDVIKKKLDDYYNIIRLCPSCHRMIHYGNNETRKKMVDCILKQCDKNNLEEVVKLLDHKSDLETYIYDIYEIEKH